jgi:hypothetical protein
VLKKIQRVDLSKADEDNIYKKITFRIIKKSIDSPKEIEREAD